MPEHHAQMPSPFVSEVSHNNGQPVVVRLSGCVALADGARLHDVLHAATTTAITNQKPLRIDLGEVERLDGASAAILQAQLQRARMAGNEADVAGAQEDVARQLELYACKDDAGCLKAAPRSIGLLDQIGRVTRESVHEFVLVMAFVGQFSRALKRILKRPQSVPWHTLPTLMNRAGSDGVVIVVLINFLVGFTIALASAAILARFGANVFVAELIGFSVLRELGPLMTAIVVAGRSGASYAAELGTMEVGEEVAALRTMSLDPMRYLVLPRTLALMLVMPLLTAIADVVAVAGGGLVAVTRLQLTEGIFLGRLQDSIAVGDVLFGLVKSVAFAFAIAMVACQRGLRTRGGAAGVGASTTSAVVVSLFLLVGLNAVFAALAELLGW